ncbi:hypothetical protein [Gimesia sp.]|uniref:hypothetical protein n=1 Tax=Gimesia sp. TaxID=2024833 RepID=UPI003A916C48
MDRSAWIAGELAEWPTKTVMAQLLKQAGLRVHVGQYSIQIEVGEGIGFSFVEYGGDLGDPAVCAEADTAEDLMCAAKRVSNVLTTAKLRHRFEIYDHRPTMAGYLHYNWPLKHE